jgi:hypothetical protein
MFPGGFLTLLVCAIAACAGQAPRPAPAVAPHVTKAAEPAPWRSLFDGRSLAGWLPTNFGGEGAVAVKQGDILFAPGDPLTGITWAGADLPRMNYEVSLQAMKREGNDFFCALTFPVADAACSLIVGGWSGTVVGLSSLNGRDASENQTRRIMRFQHRRWYHIRVRVTPSRIEAWIDGQQIVDAVTAGRGISVRPEVELSRPLGIASYLTAAAVRDVRIRALK